MRLLICILAFVAALIVAQKSVAAEPEKKVWDFDKDTTGKIAEGFTNEVGKWAVEKSERGNALAQKAKNANPVFNITLIKDTNASDGEIGVKIKAVAGEIDQGGGIVWRAKDAKNYYLARYNPLEDNYRFYKVVDGKRTLLQNADITHSEGWHTLRVVVKGDHVVCYYDDKKFLDHNDDAIKKSGRIGLWSKADAQSQFDDLTFVGDARRTSGAKERKRQSNER
jgi:hypothetical protein